MKICFIISGIPRTYYENLHLFFIELYNHTKDFDVYLNISEEKDTQYYNKSYNHNILNKYPFYKKIIISNNIYFNDKTKKENNILNQWNRVNELFYQIKNNYNIYIRLRTDIKLLVTAKEFLNIIFSCDTNKLFIPNGFDFFNGSYISHDSCINDQIALTNKENMNTYIDFYNYIKMKNELIISEKDLYEYFKLNNIEIIRFILPYKIILSECKVISIAGDSGSGKSTLANILQDLLFDSSVTVETDRYHKWERNSNNWNLYTHLNPKANYLEKMSEDIFRLKLGETIFSIDYDHLSGKFTEETKIESKPYILLCGLHTLYEKNIRDISEIKIFLDTEQELKTEWKIKRDIIERNKIKEDIIKSIESRNNDYKLYIEPQKYHSDIIIELKKDNELTIHISNELNYYVNPFLSQISIYDKINNFNVYTINKNKLNNTVFSIFVKNTEIFSKLKEYPFNIIQTIIYLSLFND